MLGRLFRKNQPTRALPAIPTGERVYAIGDIHGNLDLLSDLIRKIDADNAGRAPAKTTIIFLGDLIDRGPDSAGVIEAAMALAQGDAGPAVRFLKGNHEEVFQRAASGDERALRHFIRMGGRETILSYPIAQADYDNLTVEELAQRLLTLVPRTHVDFVTDFENCIVIGDYAFVHAGVKPGVPVAEQKTGDLRWIREGFINDNSPHDKMIVHGHTIFAEVDMQTNRIGVDTGAYRTGKLSALGLEGTERWVLQATGEAHPERAQDGWAG